MGRTATSNATGGGGRRTNPEWLQYSSFHANDTMITIVPSISSDSDTQLPLLSSKHASSVGPFVAGMPCQVPLWMAKVLHQRHLAQIQLPEWLSSTPMSSNNHDDEDNNNDEDHSRSGGGGSSNRSYLVQALHDEKQQANLLSSDRLPFYYYEIARALSPSNASSSSSSSGSAMSTTMTTGASLVEPSTQLVLQDLHTVRVDKIRQHFHQLSNDELSQDGELTNMIEVTGIASMELAVLGPFLKQAFTDYGQLTKVVAEGLDGAAEGEENQGVGTVNQASSKEKDLGSSSSPSKENDDTVHKADRQRTSLVRSRLRRFRS